MHTCIHGSLGCLDFGFLAIIIWNHLISMKTCWYQIGFGILYMDTGVQECLVIECDFLVGVLHLSYALGRKVMPSYD